MPPAHVQAPLSQATPVGHALPHAPQFKGSAASATHSLPPHFSQPLAVAMPWIQSAMHCALAAIPGAIAYRANPMTYLMGRMLVRVEYLGIANLLLGEPMYPEYIQNAATPAALAKELRMLVEEPALLKAIKR